MPIDKKAVQERLKSFDFPGLFTQELGWDWHKATVTVSLGQQKHTLNAVAEKRGFVVFHYALPQDVRGFDYATLRCLR